MQTVPLKEVLEDADNALRLKLSGGTKQRESNTEFITRLMDMAPTGAMAQLFIMEAIHQSAKHFAIYDIPHNGMIHPQAWKDTAKWLKQQGELHAKQG